MFKGRFTISLLLGSISLTLFADTDPCAGSSAILNLIDRPSNADSVCVVPKNKIIVEAGYLHENLADHQGQLISYTNSEVRFGLGHATELYSLVPSYTTQTYAPFSGFNNTYIGLKHLLGHDEHWIVTAESSLVLPDGSAAFGNKESGIDANVIFSYTFNPKYNLTFMLGVSDVSVSRYWGGQRYSTVNPDWILTYSLNDKTNMFAEIYGQTHTGPFAGSGFNADLGIMHMIRSNIVIDFAVGQNIYGELFGINNYISTGISIMF